MREEKLTPQGVSDRQSGLLSLNVFICSANYQGSTHTEVVDVA